MKWRYKDVVYVSILNLFFFGSFFFIFNMLDILSRGAIFNKPLAGITDDVFTEILHASMNSLSGIPLSLLCFFVASWINHLLIRLPIVVRVLGIMSSTALVGCIIDMSLRLLDKTFWYPIIFTICGGGAGLAVIIVLKTRRGLKKGAGELMPFG